MPIAAAALLACGAERLAAPSAAPATHVIASPVATAASVAASTAQVLDLTNRLEQPRFFVDHNGADGATLTSSYVLGARFTVKIEAAGGEIKVYFNGSATPPDTLRLNGGGNYFKAGAYTQSNCTRERTCALDNFGEVVIYHLMVSHQ